MTNYPSASVLWVCLMLLSSGALALGSQAAPAAQPSRGEILTVSREIIKHARYCTFVTVGADGHPQARIVDPLSPDEDFTIWLATNPLTRKVGEVQRDRRVTLSCFDAASSSYVTLLGHATIVTDAAERSRRWKPEWTPFYPGGASGANVLLIRINPVRLEIVSPDRGMGGDPQTWLPTTISFP